MDWSHSPDVDRIAGKASGAWLVEGTRLPAEAILVHANECMLKEIATKLLQGISPENVRRLLAFAEARRSAPAVTQTRRSPESQPKGDP